MKENLTKEQKLITDRLKEIVEISRERYNTGERNTRTVDGKIIMADLVEEYNSLMKMKEILSNRFYEEHDFEYFEERKNTKLDPITPEEYGRIKGEALSSSTIKNNPAPSPKPAAPKPTTPKSEPKPATPKPATPKSEPKPAEPKPTTPKLAPEPAPSAPTSEPEKPVKHKITKKEIFRWIGEHKKQILIAVGLTALSVAVIVAIANLIPAIMAATQATQVAGLAGQMVANGQLWFTSTAAEQVALHGANTALASTISGITGAANSFNAASGIWTIGAQTLPEFVAASNSLAASSLAKLGIIKGITAGTALGGLGALGAGLIPGHKKTDAYYKINKKIKLISRMIKDLDEAEYKQFIQNVIAEINSSTELTSKEKADLLTKVQNILKKHNITVEPPKKEKTKKKEETKEQEMPAKKKLNKRR